MEFPKFYRVAHRFDETSILDIEGAVREQFEAFTPTRAVNPGQSVAVGVASRGTHDLKDLVRCTIQCLKEMGLEPFIIPAMGSHGGGTGEGQAKVLADLGISEETMGVPVVATMDVVSLGRVESGAEVFFSKDAMEADHVVVINRVKPHTAFRAEVESGISKILAVGCGRQVGASNMHKYDLGKTIVPASKLIIEKAPVLCGLAVTENALGGTHSIRLASPEEFSTVDRELLKEAWKLFPRLPVNDLDILAIDEMGKDVSGTGMDTNIIGQWRREGGDRIPNYRILVVLDLTLQSHGNATGIGMADIIPRRLRDKIDMQATYLNALSSGLLRSVRIPLTLENDLAVMEAAFNQVPDPISARAIRIANTSSLGTFWATELVVNQLKSQVNLEMSDEPLTLTFDEEKRLLPFPFKSIRR